MWPEYHVPLIVSQKSIQGSFKKFNDATDIKKRKVIITKQTSYGS